MDRQDNVEMRNNTYVLYRIFAQCIVPATKIQPLLRIGSITKPAARISMVPGKLR